MAVDPVTWGEGGKNTQQQSSGDRVGGSGPGLKRQSPPRLGGADYWLGKKRVSLMGESLVTYGGTLATFIPSTTGCLWHLPSSKFEIFRFFNPAPMSSCSLFRSLPISVRLSDYLSVCLLSVYYLSGCMPISSLSVSVPRKQRWRGARRSL